MSTVQKEFTLETVGWEAWPDTVDIAAATAEQIAVLKDSSPTGMTSPYYLLLVHDVDALRERTGLFKAVMYAGGGLARADRELASVGTSRVNGCVYCASVHAQRFVQLRKGTEELIQRVLDVGVETELGEHDRAVVDYAVKLTREPEQVSGKDLEPLRRLGLNDLQILDLTHV